MNLIQSTLDISRFVGSKEWYRDISGSAIYPAAVMSQNFTPCPSAVWAIMGVLRVSPQIQHIDKEYNVISSKSDVEQQTHAVGCSNQDRLFINDQLEAMHLRRSLSPVAIYFDQTSKLQLVKPGCNKLSMSIFGNLDGNFR